MPKEIGYFVPPDPKIESAPASRLVAQTEDVLVDRRGCIYVSDKNRDLYSAAEDNLALHLRIRWGNL